MLKKFIGTERSIVIIGSESYGEVSPGESIVVPDDIASTVKWPEKLWADATKASSRRTTTKEKA